VGVPEHLEALNSRYGASLPSPIAKLVVRSTNEADILRHEIVELEGHTFAFIDFDPNTEAVTFVTADNALNLFTAVQEWRGTADIKIDDAMLAAAFITFWSDLFDLDIN
jgi:ribosomal protein S18 acetylase RimI-like enzyme